MKVLGLLVPGTIKYEVVKIKAYIWMGGCDYDCNNSTVNEITGDTNKITATLGFCAGSAQ